MKKELRVGKCESCNKKFECKRSGPIPKHCNDCSERTEIDRTEGVRKSAVRRKQSSRVLPYKIVEDEIHVMRAAVGLSIIPDDDVRALRIAGIDLSKAKAKKLADQARKEYPDIVKGKPQATAMLTDRILTMMNVQMLQDVHLLSPRDLTSGMHQVVRFKELYTGEAKQQYGNITVNMAPPTPDREGPKE